MILGWLDIFPPFLSLGVGPLFRDFSHTTGTYPPHNIVTISDNEFNLELAIAGFKKNEVTIKEENGVLTISADKSAKRDASSYQYHGIATRSFSKAFRIAEYFEIKEANMEDGILTVKFYKNAPLTKSKLISIS